MFAPRVPHVPHHVLQGLRVMNPLENSMAAESVFVYPNGRELPKAGARGGGMMQPISEVSPHYGSTIEGRLPYTVPFFQVSPS